MQTEEEKRREEEWAKEIEEANRKSDKFWNDPYVFVCTIAGVCGLLYLYFKYVV